MMTRASIAGLLALIASACGSTARSADEAPVADTPPSAALASGSCGGKSQPDCPLQGWMKSTLQSYQKEKDYTRLQTSLEKLAANAPAGYGTWKDLALAGAAAAEKHDDTAISKNCKTCHNEHRARFRKERRAEPVF